jgi:hypothetical protein
MNKDVNNLTNEQIEFEMSKISEQIDKLYEKNEAYSEELRRRQDAEVNLTNELLGVEDGIFIVAIAKHLDYHLSLVRVYSRVKVDKFGIEFLLNDYRVDDFEYSYRVSSQRQYSRVFHDLISEYDLYATDSPSSIDDIIKSFVKLGVSTDNYKELIKGKIMGSITGSITTV